MHKVDKLKANHHALITETELFSFDRDLTVQYEVAFQVSREISD